MVAPTRTRPLQAVVLQGETLAAAIAWAQARALDEALLLANLTQLAADSLPVGVFEEGRVRGLACCYTGLPFLAVSIWSEGPAVAAALLSLLAARQPRLRSEAAYALVAEPIRRQLEQVTRVEEAPAETKRLLRPEGLAPLSPGAARWQTSPLGPDDLPAMEALYRTVPAIAWTPKALAYGPWRGVYIHGELAAAAGVHFCLPPVTEIGHIVTRPEHRRQGLAEAAIHDLVADLQGRTERIFLMHFADNRPAARLYERLGFAPYAELFLTRFRLTPRA